MSRFLSYAGLLVYVVIAALALFWWMPHFFAANLHTLPQLNYRYVAATGVPLALFLATVVARQSLQPRFSLILVLQVVLSSLALWLGIYTFDYTPQSVTFCALHLALSAVFFLWNINRYRRELLEAARRRSALSA